MARKSRKNTATSISEDFFTTTYIRTAQYIRLSVEDSKKKGDSIENQKLILDDFIAQHPNMQCSGAYIDNGLTGMNFNRPEFQRLIADIEAGKINCVIVKDFSRLGRNSIDTGFYIERFFPEHKIRFISVNDEFDTDEPKTNDRLMLYLKNIINEAYAVDIGKKVKSQARQAMRDGRYVSARPKFGYLKDPNDCHKLIINPEIAPIIKMIFDLYLGGMTETNISLKLTEMEIPTPSVYGYKKGYIKSKKSVGKENWDSRKIKEILQSEIYTGKLVQGRTETIAHNQVSRDRSKWIVVEDTHEAIISQEIFDKVQKRMSEKKEEYLKKNINPYPENILKGKIFCGHCGIRMNRHRSVRKKVADRYIFYCLTNARYKRGGCENDYIYEEELLSAIMTALKVQANVLLERKKKLSFALNDNVSVNRHNEKIKKLKAYISKNQNFLSSLYENLVNGLITPEEYRDMRKSYGDKISETVKEIHYCETQKKAIEKEYIRYNEMGSVIDLLFSSGKFTKEVIDSLVDKVVIYKGKRVEVTFNFNNEFENEVNVDV